MIKPLRTLGVLALAFSLSTIPVAATEGNGVIFTDKDPKVSLVPQSSEKPGDGLSAACFAVYCDGNYSGWVVCGSDLGEIIDVAIGICGAS